MCACVVSACIVHCNMHEHRRMYTHTHTNMYAILQHRRLDAVYYYIRSLTASNPFLSAKESLAALFDETSKKVTVMFVTLLDCCISIIKAEMEEENLKMDEERKRRRSECKQKRQDKQTSEIRCG